MSLKYNLRSSIMRKKKFKLKKKDKPIFYDNFYFIINGILRTTY